MTKFFKCPDCDAEIVVPEDAESGQIYSCSCCNLELEYKNGELVQLVIENEDFGE